MTLNTMLYDHVNEGIEWESINDFYDDDDPLKKQLVYEENITEQVLNDTTTPEVQDPTYIRWQIFDEIPERLMKQTGTTMPTNSLTIYIAKYIFINTN